MEAPGACIILVKQLGDQGSLFLPVRIQSVYADRVLFLVFVVMQRCLPMEAGSAILIPSGTEFDCERILARVGVAKRCAWKALDYFQST